MALAEKVLKIRNRLGRNVALAANPAQRMYEEKAEPEKYRAEGPADGRDHVDCGAIFFAHHHPSRERVTVQVAHTQEAAEQIFRIVHRFLALLPASLCARALENVQ